MCNDLPGPEWDATPEYRGVARWLTLAIALLIVWGSLYPFDFLLPTGEQLKDRLVHVASHAYSRADFVANLLLYLPLGAMLPLAFGGSSSIRRIAWSTLGGSLLSLSMELVQLTTPHRVTSAFDWTLNTFGTLIGASAVSLYLMVGKRWRFAALLDPRPALIPLSLLALWLVTQLIPSGPMHGAPWLAKLSPAGYLPTPRSTTGWAVALATWWIVAESGRYILRPAWALGGFAACAALNLSVRFMSGLRPPNALDVGSALIALAAAALALQWGRRPRAFVTSIMCIVALIAEGSSTIAAGAKVGSFHWVPFSGSLLTTRDYGPLLHHLFLHGALLWSLAILFRRVRWAVLLTFGLTLAIELGQMWMPHRRAEITDPLLVLALAAAVTIVLRFQRDALGAGALEAASEPASGGETNKSG